MDLERVTWITVHLLGLNSCPIPMTILPTCPDLLGVFEHVLCLIWPDKLLCHQLLSYLDNMSNRRFSAMVF